MSASYLAAAETRTADRPKRGLKVIGAGCGRTGTASLKAALETLGFDPCYHMFEVVKNGHSTRWTEAFSSPSTADWAGLVEGFEASVDFPASTAYVELMAAFPDAKVVLSVRDPKSWARSVRDTIWSPYGGELSWVMAPFRRDFQKMTRLFRARFFGDADGGVRSGAIFDDAVLAARFEAWNALVFAAVPAFCAPIHLHQPLPFVTHRGCAARAGHCDRAEGASPRLPRRGWLGAAVQISRRAGAGGAIPERQRHGR
eukprot:6017667-Prymnesium_polylepis.1